MSTRALLLLVLAVPTLALAGCIEDPETPCTPRQETPTDIPTLRAEPTTYDGTCVAVEGYLGGFVRADYHGLWDYVLYSEPNNTSLAITLRLLEQWRGPPDARLAIEGTFGHAAKDTAHPYDGHWVVADRVHFLGQRNWTEP